MIEDKFSGYETGRLLAWEKELMSSLDRMTGRGIWQVRCYEKLGSTMDKSREVMKDLSKGNAGLVLTQAQESGRGRQGRARP